MESIYFFLCLIGFFCSSKQNNYFLTRKKYEDGQVILANGKTASEGNVQIMYQKQWGSICDDEWDIQDANVVCRQLGYTRALQTTTGSYFGPANSPFWMDNVYCNGNERQLSNCRFDGWGRHDCSISEAAGVICEQINKTTITKVPAEKSNCTVRLTGGKFVKEGKVEIKWQNIEWITIDGKGWTILEAMVICRMAGFGYAKSATQTKFLADNCLPVAVNGFKCRGNESDINQCYTNNLQIVTTTLTQHRYVAGVTCTETLPDLVIDAETIMKSSYLHCRSLQYLQCAMEENCLASSAYNIKKCHKHDWYLQVRKLLRFTAKITNIGNTAFRPFKQKELWDYHQCHRHYHSMEVFATFDVLNLNYVKVAEGHKASFCLEDNECSLGTKPFYSCINHGDQGISVNCSDIYKHVVDCQWVDITDLTPGLYIFKVTINPEFKVPEMTYNNNVAVCSMNYTGKSVTVYNCYTQHP